MALLIGQIGSQPKYHLVYWELVIYFISLAYRILFFSVAHSISPLHTFHKHRVQDTGNFHGLD